MPNPLSRAKDPIQSARVVGNSEVSVVTNQLLRECSVLRLDVLMSIPTTPFVNAAKRTAEAILRRLLDHHPVSLAGETPVMGKAE